MTTTKAGNSVGSSGSNLLQIVEKSGFKYAYDLIHLYKGGSDLHGAKLDDSDLDIYGIWVEEPASIIGCTPGPDNFTWGTSDQYEKNRAGDIDIKLYPLQRWAKLACQGNPTILSFLFARSELHDCGIHNNVWEFEILTRYQDFIAASHAQAFLGYGDSQLKRMQGLKGLGKHGQRPVLIEQYGYDTKAASHLIRLMYEGIELMQIGKLIYPRKEVDLLIDIRKGKYTQSQIEKMYLELEASLRQEAQKSQLPKEIDTKLVNKIISNTYMESWGNSLFYDISAHANPEQTEEAGTDC